MGAVVASVVIVKVMVTFRATRRLKFCMGTRALECPLPPLQS